MSFRNFQWPFKNQVVSDDEKLTMLSKVEMVQRSLKSLMEDGVEDEDERQAYLNVLLANINDLQDIRHMLIEEGGA